MKFFKNFLNKFKPVPINIGDKFIDKDWGETEIEIVQLHQTKKLVRYKFIKIDNKPTPDSSIHDTPEWLIRSDYKKL